MHAHGRRRKFARRFRDFQANLGLEPLAMLIHQGDQRDRRSTNLRRERGEIVQRLLRQRIENGILPKASMRRASSGVSWAKSILLLGRGIEKYHRDFSVKSGYAVVLLSGETSSVNVL